MTNTQELLSKYFPSETIVECEKCNQDCSGDEIKLISNQIWLCPSCVNEYCLACIRCGEMQLADDTELADDGIVCKWCLNERGDL